MISEIEMDNTDGRDYREDPQRKIISHQSGSFSVPACEPRIHQPSRVIPEMAPKSNRTCEIPIAKDRTLQEMQTATSSRISSRERSATEESDQYNRGEVAQAQTEDPERGESRSSAVNGGISEKTAQRSSNTVTGVEDSVPFFQRGDMPAKRSKDLSPHHYRRDQVEEVTGEEAEKVTVSRQRPLAMKHPSSREDSDSNIEVDTEAFGLTDLLPLRKRDTTLKLRMPLKGRLAKTLGRLSSTKRRRESIYDLESDEGTGQGLYGFRRVPLDSESTASQYNAPWKKIRLEIPHPLH